MARPSRRSASPSRSTRPCCCGRRHRHQRGRAAGLAAHGQRPFARHMAGVPVPRPGRDDSERARRAGRHDQAGDGGAAGRPRAARLVRRVPDPTDRRAKLVLLSARGQEVVAIVRGLVPEMEDRLVDCSQLSALAAAPGRPPHDPRSLRRAAALSRSRGTQVASASSGGISVGRLPEPEPASSSPRHVDDPQPTARCS